MPLGRCAGEQPHHPAAWRVVYLHMSAWVAHALSSGILPPVPAVLCCACHCWCCPKRPVEKPAGRCLRKQAQALWQVQVKILAGHP